MTAINELVEVAGSMRISGKFGMLSEAAAGISVPFSVLYESVPRVTIPVTALGNARAEAPAEQPLSVDILSLIEEVRRSVLELKARTASVPEIYTYYIPPAVRAPVPAAPAAPAMPPADSPPVTYITERIIPADKRPDSIEPVNVAQPKPVHTMDGDIVRSNQALGRLVDNYTDLTFDLAEVERLIADAMRSAPVNIPAAARDKTLSLVPEKGLPLPVTAVSAPAPGIEYVERQAPEAIVREKTVMIKEESGKVASREKPAVTPDTAVTRPPGLASALAQGISLPGILRQSTVEMMVLQTVLATPAPVTVAPAPAASVPEPLQPLAAPVAGSITASVEAPEKIIIKLVPTPVAQALDIARTFNGLIGSYLALRGTAPGKAAMKEGVTQLLLSLPGQKAAEEPVSGLFDVMAGLQAARPQTIETPQVARPQTTETLQPVEITTLAPAAALPPEEEPMRSTILGDLRELQGTMLSLQNAVGGLEKAGISPPEMPGAAGAPAPAMPEYDGVPGERAIQLTIIQSSIARLQAAMDYLRVNVPTLADFVVLQKAVASVPVVGVPGAGAPASITIEGVQPKSAAPISLPDLSWIYREFGQMQGVIARLQVPMYAEGGLVDEPTLAFVGEAEPEFIVPMSVVAESQAKMKEFYLLLWAEIQTLGASMQDTVKGVNTALESVQASGGGGGGGDSGGEEDSAEKDLGTQVEETMQGMIDKYLGMIGLSIDTLKNAQKTAGMGVVLGTATVALPYAKDLILGKEDEDEDKDDDDSGGDDDDKDEEDDEEDFWDLVDGLDDAGSISDKRDGKFGDDGDDE